MQQPKDRPRSDGESDGEQVLNRLEGELADAADRVDALRAQAPAALPESSWMSRALREIDAAHEELRTATEELHAQAGALASAEDRLGVERRRYRELFDAAPEAYFVTDLRGIVREVNQRGCELLGLVSQFICGTPLSMRVAKPDRADYQKALRVAVANQSSRLALHVMRRDRGLAPIAVSVSVSRIARLADGAALCWVVQPSQPLTAAHDESDLLALERHRAATLALELHHRDRRFAIVAHELRSPLSALLGWVTLARSEAPADDEARTLALDNVQSCAHMLARQVEELLDYTRIADDKLELQLQAVEPPALIEDVCSEAEPVAQAKRVRLVRELDPALRPVRGDALRLRQVLTTLLGNAVRFTPAGGTVQVSALQREHTVEVAVRDSGTGIAAESLARVFEPFVRLSLRPPGFGMGLGLHISRRIAELHGGNLSAVSDGLGYGATFRLVLPSPA